MSDERLRELERRFRASDSVEDEAAWLRARVQAGELSQARFDLAQFLTSARQQGADLVELFESLEERGLEVSQRARLAVARSVGTVWESDEVWRGSLESLLDLAEGYLVDPSPARAARLREAIPVPVGGSKKARQFRDVALSAASHVYGSRESESLLNFDGRCPALTSHGFAMACLRLLMLDGALAAVSEEVRPWALGYRDPVRERAEARQQEAGGE